MKLNLWGLCLLGWLTITSLAPADEAPASREELKKLVAAINYQHGTITLPGNIATLNLPTNLCYLSPKDADTVLVKLWGNPPGRKTLGMLVPTDKKPYQKGCWAVAVTLAEDGYVKDDDAGKINYDDLLKKMQAAAKENNKERTAKGYPAVELAGWAEPPHYDAATHKLYWAKDVKFDGESQDTLNYDIRILGRRGVLVLQAIAGMNQLQEIRDQTPQLLAAVDFNEGSRYADFDPKVDKVATYGIAALVAGGIAAKLGFFKLLLVGLLAAKKFIIIAAVAVTAWVRKIFAKRKGPAA